MPIVWVAPEVAATVSWTAPTQNTDGSALTGDDAITAFRVSWYKDDIFVNSARASSGATSLIVSDLPAGTYKFYVTTIAVDNEESDPLYAGQKVIA